MGMSEPLNPITALRRMHPGWEIRVEEGHFVAILRPARNTEHVLIGHTLDELAAKLDAEDSRER